jgi:hypothetical protein
MKDNIKSIFRKFCRLFKRVKKHIKEKRKALDQTKFLFGQRKSIKL